MKPVQPAISPGYSLNVVQWSVPSSRSLDWQACWPTPATAGLSKPTAGANCIIFKPPKMGIFSSAAPWSDPKIDCGTFFCRVGAGPSGTTCIVCDGGGSRPRVHWPKDSPYRAIPDFISYSPGRWMGCTFPSIVLTMPAISGNMRPSYIEKKFIILISIGKILY